MPRPRDADALLEQALEQPEAVRAAFVAEACDDAALRAEVMEKLRAHEALSREMHERLDPFALRAANNPSARADPNGLAGQTVGHYAVDGLLGGGGMGVVYRATDTRLRRTVALKFLPSVLSMDAPTRERFAAEAQAASALDHANICTVYEIGETDDGQLFIAMAHCPGATLKARLADGPLATDDALDYARQTADALACAHGAGIVHRDVKPANVMVTPEGRVKLLDFGLAKVSDLQLTQTGTTMGTVSYMSPEQTRGEPVDGRTDVWALGVMLYEMLTGVRPFDGAYEQATVYNILNEAPPALSARAPDVPPGLAAVVMRCLEKERTLRYPDAAALLHDLDALRAGTAVAAPHVRRGAFSRRTWAVLGVGLAGVLLAVALFFRPEESASMLPGDAGVRRVAVLPFVDVDLKTDNQAFIDGMVYTISSTLVEMEKLAGRISVVPASDVLQAGLTSAPEAARAFDAQLVLTGSVLPGGTRLRFILDLFDARANGIVNSLRLDQQRADPLALQDSVAFYVATLLGVQLDAEARKALGAGGTASADAFDAYTRARGYLLRYETPANVERAITLFERALAADSLYALAHAGLGEAYWRRYEQTNDAQWVEKAARSGERAVRLAPALSAVRVTLGMVYKGTGRYDEAEAELKRALDIDPQNAFAHQQLAATFYYQGRLEEAEASYKDALRLKPGYWAFHNNLGFLYNAEGRHEEAAAAYRQVIALRPDSPWGYNNLGVQYERLGRFGEARRWYQQAATVNPGATTPTALAQRNLGSLAYRQRDFAGAARLYEQAQRSDSTDADGWSNLANAYHWAGGEAAAQAAWARAIALDERALRVNPDRDDALERLLVNYARTGRMDDARQMARRVERLPRLDSEAYLALALLHEARGARADALGALEKGFAVGLTPSRVDASVWLDDLRADPAYDALVPRPDER